MMTIGILDSYAWSHIISSVISMVFYCLINFLMIPVNGLAIIYVITFEIYSIIEVVSA